MVTRRKFLGTTTVLLAASPLRSFACMGDPKPVIFDIGPGSLPNILPLDTGDYLKSLYPSGLSHDANLKVEVPASGAPHDDGIFVVDYRFHVRISISNLLNNKHCSSIRLFYNINYSRSYIKKKPLVPSFCFEVGRYNLGLASIPDLSTSLQYVGPGAGIFATANIEGPDGSMSVISSNIVKIRDTCGYGPLLNYVHT